MNAYPIGNDLTVKWSLLYSDGSVFPLSNYDYELSYRTNRGNKVVTDTSVISVDENILTWTFKGDEQVVSGRYTICLKITLSGSKVVELQYDNAFMLSPLSGFKGAGSEIVLQSYCDAIDLKDAVLQARKAMDIAGSAVNTAGGAATTANDAKAIASTANNTSTEAKTIANNAKTVADQAKDTADAAAATATQKAEEVAQKEAQLEAALNNLSTDQSGALALSTKVNEHGEKLSELERVIGMTSIEVPEFVIGMETTDGHSVTYFEASNRCRFADGMYIESHQGDIFRTDWSNYGMYVIEGVIIDGVWQYESQGWKSADYVAKFENGRVYCAFRHNDQRDISQEDINIIKGAFSFIPLVPSKNNIEKLDERVTALEQAIPSPSDEYVPFAGKLICGIGDSIMIGVAPNGEAIVDGEGEMGMQFNSSGGFLGSIKRKYPSVTTLNMGIGGTTIARNAQVPSNDYGCIADRINNIPDSVDYIILEGGINDYFHLDKIPFGAEDLLKDYTPYFAEWDSSTKTYKDLTMGIKYSGGGEDNIFAYENFVGALHIVLTKIMTRFYDKKYMYVIPHNTNNDPVEDKYFDAIVSVCKKMQFPCLDLRLYSGMPRIAQLAGVDSTSREHKFTIDAVHPNQLGYDMRYMPAIVDFMKKL